MPGSSALRALAVVALLGLSASCGAAAGTGEPPPPGPSSPASGSSNSPSPTASPVDPASVNANELGQIPVLMIHRVAKGATGDYAQTPKQFRKTMTYLARNHYVPITAAELVSGEIDIPAGASPVVLTFDDGYADHIRLRPDGDVDPASAVGIMREVAEEYPDFRPVGTVYVNRDPFGDDSAVKLRWLAEHDWEIGNHTANHANLRALDATGVQRELVQGEQAITEAVPGHPVTTMALPLGAMPRNEKLAHTGKWKGTRYDYQGVMLVGANPAPSPFHADWDPFHIPRIRSWGGKISHDQQYWLPRLEKTRYVSDGSPDIISFPRSAHPDLTPAHQTRANPY